jgi:hypothetical protein
MAAQDSRTSSSLNLPVGSGGVAGAVAFLAGYVLTFLVKSGDVSDLLTRSLGEAQGSGLALPGDWQVVGWMFFQMHNVATETTLTIGGQSQTTTTAGSVESWLLLVPLVLLAAAGFVVARQATVTDTLAGAQAGAMVTVGYAVCTLLGGFLVTWSASGFGGGASISIGPPLLTGTLTAGLIYPLVVGAVGGALGATTAE